MTSVSLEQYTERLLSFVNSAPTAFHAVATIRERFLAHGFIELHEHQQWQLTRGQRYFIIRDSGAIVAFILGNSDEPGHGFRMIAAHSDSPGLQLKPRAEFSLGPYLQVGVEIYGGPLLATWFDRELSLAGRVYCRSASDVLGEYLIDFARPIITIPSLAIHFDREANNGKAIDKQKALPPLLAQTLVDQLPDFQNILRHQLGLQYPDAGIDKVLGFDLFCYDYLPAGYIGLNREFITGGRLDNLLSCHAGTEAMLNCDGEHNVLFLCTNHEENGSTSTSGANGGLIEAVFSRIIPDCELRQISLRRSFLVSMDNAHATHPNFRDKSDPNHEILLNSGPVIKVNANQRYATNSKSASVFKILADQAGVPVQEFVMRSDLPCGSTIGPMTAARLGVDTIDVGAPTLAMHSIRELTGTNDPYLLFMVIGQFLGSETFWCQDSQ